jgi:UDP-sulfoquinovose synthase
MRILVLGGDGYLGWPQTLYLSAQGHDVHVVDNLVRRHFNLQHGIASVTPISSPQARVAQWRSTGLDVGLDIVDLTDEAALSSLSERQTQSGRPLCVTR